MKVGEVKFFRKLWISNEIMIVVRRKVPAKFVPAAAVTRMEQVLFTLTRCKGLSGGRVVFFLKGWDLILWLELRLNDWNWWDIQDIFNVKVEFVEIEKMTDQVETLYND